MVEVLSIEYCKQLLQNKSASPTRQDYVNILDSVTVHIQSSDIALQAEDVAVIVEALKEPIKCLFNTIDTLEKELEDLKKKYEILQELESALISGQIASNLEKKILRIILQGTSVSLEYATLITLENALNDTSGQRRTGMQLSDKDKRIAKENWDRLEREVHLENELYLAIDKLKQSRNPKAHPKVNYDTIRNHLAKLEGDHKQQIEKMFRVMRELDCRNQ